MNGLDVLFTAALSMLVLLAIACTACVLIDTLMNVIRYRDAKCAECKYLSTCEQEQEHEQEQEQEQEADD